MSMFSRLNDQENVHPIQPPGKGHVAPVRGSRPVLGEISQNVTARRQPLRSSKQPEKNGFSIFCDENAGVSKPKPMVKSSYKSAIPIPFEDKENVVSRQIFPLSCHVRGLLHLGLLFRPASDFFSMGQQNFK